MLVSEVLKFLETIIIINKALKDKSKVKFNNFITMWYYTTGLITHFSFITCKSVYFPTIISAK